MTPPVSINNYDQSQIVRSFVCSSSSENNDMLPQDVSVLRRDSLLNDRDLSLIEH